MSSENLVEKKVEKVEKTEQVTKDDAKELESAIEKKILKRMLIATFTPFLIHPPFALTVGYLIKKKWVITNILPYIKPIIKQSNVPFGMVGALVAFMWFSMTAWTITSRMAQGTYDINSPRLSQKRVTGLSERLQSAYENTLEQFPAFAAGVIIAHLTKVPLGIQISCTVSYYLFRWIWFISYVSNYPIIRAIFFILANWSMFYLYLFSVINNFSSYFEMIYEELFLSAKFRILTVPLFLLELVGSKLYS
ncbi:hypothetical protein CONCODRAFT_2204 [Conidiobolus coronatus NRRL 28638]|uniref:Uncharacterized protein n=1 Tax=Conidiobolus coronatus (strain ATCC 28846 / CBS 209.66 / NRRL 28638) TaxID=796925 RepID=A0A137PI20_CONC2|nr:hypothetical protein CONCODRAFT_2204 [Conidiobolus coronatus NRRL 28638]|eukprot:KXN74647.1 hypothetical protein CONCODRAFT_2204 [Conidiobolus coronatus NRRL 28638]